MATRAKQRGQIISFYSFKGGVGRTMALANIGYILARRPVNLGKDRKRSKVLMVDFDLESPGLPYYFCNEISIEDKKGVVQLLHDINLTQTLDIPKAQRPQVLDRTLDEVVWTDYCHQIPSIDNLDLWLMPHSRDSKDYIYELATLNWRSLDDLAPYALRSIFAKAAEDFDYVLIDSRTGLSEIAYFLGSIPDKMVYLFNFNRQSLLGSRPFFQHLLKNRTAAGAPLGIFPLASMIQEGIPKDAYDWVNNGVFGAKHYLASVLPTRKDEDRSEAFWESYLFTHYIPYFAQLAYGEQVLAKYPEMSSHSFVMRLGEFAEKVVTHSKPDERTARRVQASVPDASDTAPSRGASSLKEAGDYLEIIASSSDTHERLGYETATSIRTVANALQYEELGPRLVNISRSYVETAINAQKGEDRWAPIWNQYAQELLRETEGGLERLRVGEIPEGFSSTDQGFWTAELWHRVGKSVWTTNIAGVGEFGRTLNKVSVEAQGRSVKKEVEITRVFVLENEDTDQSRRTLRKIARAQVEVGIRVFVIDRTAFNSAKGQAEDLFGSEDFMVVDELFIYVTQKKASGQKRVNVINQRSKLRAAITLRTQIEAAARHVTLDQIDALIPIGRGQEQ